MLYLLSRNVIGFLQLLNEKGILKRDYKPFLSVLSWGVVMQLFSLRREALQKSLKESMIYIYDEDPTFTAKNILF